MANNRRTRSMDEIESDLDANRERLHHTLNALERQLSPGDMTERARAYIRDSGSQEFVDNLTVSVTRNPVPLSLVGVGLSWMMLSGTSQSQEDDWTQRTDTGGETLGDKAGRAGSRAQSAAQRSRDGMHSVSSGARSVGSAGRQGAQRTKNGFDYMLREEPLASGLIGLAVGALIAASLPRTQHEDEFMGEQSDQFVDSAEASGKEQAEKARHVAEAALDAATDAGSDAASSEAERQGFSGPS